MTRLALFFVCAAAAVATVSSAEARDNCGRGWFYNGVACVQEEGYGPRPGYGYRPEPRYYQEPRYYDEGPRVYRGGGGGNGFYRGNDGQLHCYNRAFTVQDGVCKPYRGG